VLLEELEESMLSPQEKELRDLRNYKNKIDQEQKSQLAIKQEQQRLAEEQRIALELEEEILEQLSANNMKATPRNIARCAEYILASLDEQGNRLHAKDAFQRVKKDQRSDVLSYIGELSAQEIEESFPDLFRSILAHSANKGKVSLPVPFTKNTQAEQKPKNQSYSSFWNDVIKGK
jgi:hypothetical protein